MKIQGTITAKVKSGEGEGARGHWERFVFTIDGKSYSTFDPLIFAKYLVGQSVEMEGIMNEEKGFFNMKTMKLLEGDVAEVVKVAEKPVIKEFHLSVEQCRVYALDCAIKHIELVQPAGMKNLNYDQIQKSADLFFEYIMQDGK